MKITKVRFEPGTHIPCKAAADLEANTLVVITAGGINPTVNAAGAGSRPLGVVAHSVKAGDLVTVLRGSIVVEVKSTGVITVGAQVAAAANGAAAAAVDGAASIGIAVEAAVDNRVFVALT